MIQDYFSSLFKIWNPNYTNNNISNGFSRIKDDHQTMLQWPFSKEDIKQAVFDMDPFKCLGHEATCRFLLENMGNSGALSL